jgi:pre-mycofactocin synthase
MARKPIETVEDARQRAKKRLPRAVFSALLAGNERGATLDQNLQAFDSIGVIPRVGVEVESRDYNTNFMGIDMSLPLIMSPAGAQAMHVDGEVPVARATRKAGLTLGHSNFASSRFEDVIAENPNAIYQLYWTGTRDDIAVRIGRAKASGAKALILTMDALPIQARDWGSPAMPGNLNLPEMIKFAPLALSRPRWLSSYLQRGQIPDLTVPNFGDGIGDAPTMMDAFMQWLDTPLPSWDDVAWVKEAWGGPFMIKGIWHPDDALRAIDAGATAIGVSNHGGNNLDTTPSALRALPAIVSAVNGQAQVSYDGGIRRGGDIVKALALGADVVLAGRAWLFGLSADGERGVTEVITALRTSMEKFMLGLGHDSIDQISKDDLVIPDGFILEKSAFERVATLV